MKIRSYFKIALLFPYILWVICALFFFLLAKLETSSPWTIALLPITFYVFGVILWFIPYTLLAIGMLIWSRNKTIITLRKTAINAPILFFVLMLIETILVSLPAESTKEFSQNMTETSMLVGVFSLLFGYLCVGMALVLFKFLQAKDFITEELSLLPS